MGKDVPQMVSGLGMAMRLISSLNDELIAHGGQEEMLHFLTTESGRSNLSSIASLIVTLPWQVPKSVLMRLARQISIETYGDICSVADEYCFWQPALQRLGIPYISFLPDHALGNGRGSEDHSINELREQLHRQEANAGLLVRWNDIEYIVTSIGISQASPNPGDIINIGNVDFVHLTPAHYIDLSR